MLPWVFGMSAVLVGACVGSFLNVVVHRLPQEDPQMRSLGGRSRCPRCGAQIPWRNNLPVLGWLMLRGRGRCCGQPIAKRYLAVEVLTAAAFLLLALWPPHGAVVDTAGNVSGVALLAWSFDAAFLSFLIACAFIDWDHRILPDVLTKPFMAIGALAVPLLVPGFSGRPEDLDLGGLAPVPGSILVSLIGLGTGFGLTYAIRVGAHALFRKEAMGFGDVKFMGAIGAFTGWEGALLTFFLGSVVGAFGGLLHRAVTGDAYVPFGPFLAIGAALTLFAREPIVQFLFVTWPAWQRSSPLAAAVMAGLALLCMLTLVVLVRRGRGNNG